MRDIPAPDSLARGHLLGALRSWPGISSGESCSSPADFPIEYGVPHAHAHGSARVPDVNNDPANLMVTSALPESRGLVTFLAAESAEAVALAGQLRSI